MTAHGWSASSEIRIRCAMGAAMTPRRSAGETSAETDQAHWGMQPPIGVGNLPTPMLRFLPQCTERPGRSLPQCIVSCPNTPDSGAPPLRPPTPMHRFLPQYAGQRRAPASPTYPNAPFPAPMHRTACGSSGGAGSPATRRPTGLVETPADRVGAQVRARLHAPIRRTAWSFPTPRSATDHQCHAHGPTAPRLPPSRRTDRRGSR